VAIPEVSIQARTNKKNLLLLVALRWLAVGGQVAAIAVAFFLMDIPLPLGAMSSVLLLLILLNLATLHRAKSDSRITNTELFLQLMLDVVALTVQLQLSGGAANPFISLYLLQVILGAVLLRAWSVWTLVVATSLGFIGLSLSHDEIGPILFAQGHGQALYASLHMQGMFICFLLAAVLLVVFLTRINRNLRDRDKQVAEFRQQLAEEEHIVRLGLLASGAAHELGTPLATLSVILNDWERLPALKQNAELSLEFEEMRLALGRCKEIISGVLVSAGEARGEEAERTSLVAFFDDVIMEWQEIRDPARLDYHNFFAPDMMIASDLLLKQIVGNVLDNAFEASPDWLAVTISREQDHLQIAVRDRGPGFQPEKLARIGKIHQSTKGRPGRGLGLFLVVSVLRKLGGTLATANLPEGGARVVIRLPMAALAIEAALD